jgi:hypothetical protein
MRDEFWEDLARQKGYSSMRELLIDLYVTKLRTKGNIASELRCSVQTVSVLLYQKGIKDRVRESKATRIPKEDLDEMSLYDLSSKYGLSKSAIWMERKRRAKNEASGSQADREGRGKGVKDEGTDLRGGSGLGLPSGHHRQDHEKPEPAKEHQKLKGKTKR